MGPFSDRLLVITDSNKGNMGNGGRIELKGYVNANGTHHLAAATEKSQAWAVAHGYTVQVSGRPVSVSGRPVLRDCVRGQGTLGWLDRPVPAPPPSPICEPHTGTDYVCCGLKSVLNVTTAAGFFLFFPPFSAISNRKCRNCPFFVHFNKK